MRGPGYTDVVLVKVVITHSPERKDGTSLGRSMVPLWVSLFEYQFKVQQGSVYLWGRVVPEKDPERGGRLVTG